MAFKPRRRPEPYIIALAAVWLIVTAGMAWMLIAEEEKEWPFNATESAETVPLSQFQKILTEDGEGRRVATLNDKIYVEMVAAEEEEEGVEDASAQSEETAPEVSAEEVGVAEAEAEPEVVVIDIPKCLTSAPMGQICGFE